MRAAQKMNKINKNFKARVNEIHIKTETIRLEIELTINGDWGDDDDELDWFNIHVLKNKLKLWSSVIGDEVGDVKVISGGR